MTGRRSPAGRDDAVAALASYLPELGPSGARMLVDRAAGLLEAGERIGPFLARLNLPARLPDPSSIPALDEPAPSKSAAAAFSLGVRVPDFVQPVPAEVAVKAFPYVEEVDGIAVRFDLCRGCGLAFGIPRRNKPGRYPCRCPKCRGVVDPRSQTA